MSQPIDQPDETRLEKPRSFRAAIVFSLVVVAAMTGFAYWACQQLPEGARIPTHWNARGVADGFGRPGSLFIMPGLVLALTLLLAILPRIEPRRGHLLRSSKAYKAVWLAVVIFLAGFHSVTVLIALGHAVSIDRYAMAGMGALFMVIGNSLGKVRSNFAFGVRTPWSLSSELSWNKTNRFAGRMFFCFGAATIVAVLARVPALPLIVASLASLFVLGVAVILYSYYIWRQDQRKSTLGSETAAPD